VDGPITSTQTISASQAYFSGSNTVVTIVGSGSASPIFTISGSTGELFTIVDDPTGPLLTLTNTASVDVLQVLNSGVIITGSLDVTGPITSAEGFSGSFSGSFQGDGSQLTGISASILLSSASNGSGISSFTFDGSTNATIAVSGAASLSVDTITKWTGDAFSNSTITDDGTLVTFTTDALFQGDITVQGTASFQNAENLLVADRFVLFASGSNTPGDGGIVVQQGTQNVGELFGYDSTATRWGFTSSFDASSTSFAPVVYVGAVQTGTGQTAASPAPIYGGASYGYGTIHIDTDDDEIWIYA
jgi:hypothetical protein